MRSAADKAASFYRAGKKPIDPPKELSARAKAIWRQIVNSKPPVWFDGSSLGFLADHCETQARMEECWRRLRRYPVGSREGRLTGQELRQLRMSYATSARMLRLVVQYAIERRSTQAGESTPEAEGDTLIGGEAARRFRVVS